MVAQTIRRRILLTAVSGALSTMAPVGFAGTAGWAADFATGVVAETFPSGVATSPDWLSTFRNPSVNRNLQALTRLPRTQGRRYTPTSIKSVNHRIPATQETQLSARLIELYAQKHESAAPVNYIIWLGAGIYTFFPKLRARNFIQLYFNSLAPTQYLSQVKTYNLMSEDKPR